MGLLATSGATTTRVVTITKVVLVAVVIAASSKITRPTATTTNNRHRISKEVQVRDHIFLYFKREISYYCRREILNCHL